MARQRASADVATGLADLRKSREMKVSITDYIARHKQQMVLILGSYSAKGRQRIDSISAAVESAGYNPVTASIVEDVPQMSLEQKVTVLAHMARFVILEDSEASGHLYEAKLVQEGRVIVAVVRESGTYSSAMTAGLGVGSLLINEWEYPPGQIGSVVPGIATWAESQVAKLVSTWNKLYPWRRQ